jgi:hypothetical protein
VASPTLATIAPELDLVKAALLYGDKGTLLGPVTTMLLRVDGIRHFPLAARLELVRRVAPYIADPAGLPALEESLEKFGELLNAVERGPAGSRYMLGQATRQLGAELREIDEAVKHICREARIDQLARARNDGVLQIESADPGDEIDLLASCLKSAKLAETGRSEEDPHAGRIVATFADRLSHHLSSGSEYLIFDEPIASLTEAGIREGRFTPAPGPSGKCAQAMTASALMARLPTFPLATVDEVLDIRAELNPALTQFRSAMVTTAKNFTSAAWETDSRMRFIPPGWRRCSPPSNPSTTPYETTNPCPRWPPMLSVPPKPPFPGSSLSRPACPVILASSATRLSSAVALSRRQRRSRR